MDGYSTSQESLDPGLSQLGAGSARQKRMTEGWGETPVCPPRQTPCDNQAIGWAVPM